MSEAIRTRAGTVEETTEGPIVVATEDRVQNLLDLLSDPGCRSILAATTDTARSARELADSCDVPLSTTYRKLDDLVDAGLLAERTRVRRAGKHPSEFRRVVDEVVVSVRPTGDTRLVVLER